ncbi:MAG: SIR2 family protein [Gemmataceae bacterium]
MELPGQIFIAPGDITRLAADAIAFSASYRLTRDGNLCSSFEANIPEFGPWFAGLARSTPLPCPVGSTFWLPLGAGRQPGGIVLVVSTGRDPLPNKAGAAVRVAINRAVAELRQAGRTDRLLIALPAFRVGKGGDHAQRLASALAQVQAATEALRDHPNVDVAFIPYTPTLYRIFLEARRDVLGASGDTAARYPALEEAIRTDSCVLFVGAGLSSGAGLPGWNQLIARLADELGIDPDDVVDNLDVAQWYREKFGSRKLGEVLKATFDVEGVPTLAHYLLMALPVRHVITTNYDRLLEQTLGALKRYPAPVIHQEDVANTAGSGVVYVVKLHGDVSHANDIVLTREDYEAFFTRRPAMALLLEGLLLNRTFFFVGYSLRDLNFRQIFGRIARMLPRSRRPAFATSFHPAGPASGYLKQQWRQQGLELVPIEGADHGERQLRFLQFLDTLAEQVTLQGRPLVLAPDVPTAPPLEPIRQLLEQVGEGIETLLEAGSADAEVIAFLAQLLQFLTAHGWRPSGRHGIATLSRLAEVMAGHASDAYLRRRLLIAALESAETFTDVTRLRQVLADDTADG